MYHMFQKTFLVSFNVISTNDLQSNKDKKKRKRLKLNRIFFQIRDTEIL